MRRSIHRDRLYAAVTDAGRRLDIAFANAAAIDVARIGAVTQDHLQRALPLLNDGGSIILNSAGADAEGDDGTVAYAPILAAPRSLAPAWAGEHARSAVAKLRPIPGPASAATEI